MQDESTIERLSRKLTRFFGSWWAVALHSFLIFIWLVFRFKLEYFILWISLEALFLWVIYFAAYNRREEQRDKVEALHQVHLKEKLLDNLANGEKQNEKLNHIQKMVYEVKEEVKGLKKK